MSEVYRLTLSHTHCHAHLVDHGDSLRCCVVAHSDYASWKTGLTRKDTGLSRRGLPVHCCLLHMHLWGDHSEIWSTHDPHGRGGRLGMSKIDERGARTIAVGRLDWFDYLEELLRERERERERNL